MCWPSPGEPGQIGRPQSAALVTGEVVEQGRAAKILVFHYKRKKQYKKLRGHRQGYTAVRITEIAFDGQKFTAPNFRKKKQSPRRLSRSRKKTLPRSEAKAKSRQEEGGSKEASGKESRAQEEKVTPGVLAGGPASHN